MNTGWNNGSSTRLLTKLEQIVNRLTELEKKVSEQPTSDKTFYKPYGYDDYLSLYDTLDAIFKRLDDLEGKKRTFGKI